MRKIILDTETTGFSPDYGDRLVEIGCLEMIDDELTGNFFHTYLNPERTIQERIIDIHGLSYDFLQDKPLFHQKAKEFLDFIGGDVLVIHNARFDLSFLNFELTKAGFEKLQNEVIDTLLIARKKFVGKSSSLDGLCERFNISTKERELHGAIKDCELLAKVYQNMKD